MTSLLEKRPKLAFLGGLFCGAAATSLAYMLSRPSVSTCTSTVSNNTNNRTNAAIFEGGPNLCPAKDMDIPGSELRRLRKCEAVIQRRNTRIILVVERATKSHNYSAVLRTAEALGIHHMWVVAPPLFEKDAEDRRKRHKKKNQFEADAAELAEHVVFARKASKWLELRSFATSADCIAAMKEDKREIWVTDLSQAAVPLTTSAMTLPKRLALVIGTESTGASPEMLRAASQRVYLPLHGFADSLNLSVAAALVMQRLLFIDPTVVGDMPEEEKASLRAKWYPIMGRNKKQKAEFAALAKTPVQPFDDLRRCDSHRAGWVNKKVRIKNEKKGFFSGIGTE